MELDSLVLPPKGWNLWRLYLTERGELVQHGKYPHIEETTLDDNMAERSYKILKDGQTLWRCFEVLAASAEHALRVANEKRSELIESGR